MMVLFSQSSVKIVFNRVSRLSTSSIKFVHFLNQVVRLSSFSIKCRYEFVDNVVSYECGQQCELRVWTTA